MTADLLGLSGRDRITGFQGVITGQTHYISGCAQVCLMPSVDKDGKPREGQWFDEQRIELNDLARIVLDNGSTPGPDMPAPIR